MKLLLIFLSVLAHYNSAAGSIARGAHEEQLRRCSRQIQANGGTAQVAKKWLKHVLTKEPQFQTKLTAQMSRFPQGYSLHLDFENLQIKWKTENDIIIEEFRISGFITNESGQSTPVYLINDSRNWLKVRGNFRVDHVGNFVDCTLQGFTQHHAFHEAHFLLLLKNPSTAATILQVNLTVLPDTLLSYGNVMNFSDFLR